VVQDSQLTAEMYGVLNVGSPQMTWMIFRPTPLSRDGLLRLQSIRDRTQTTYGIDRHLNRDVDKCKPPADGTVCALCALLNEEGAAS